MVWTGKRGVSKEQCFLSSSPSNLLSLFSFNLTHPFLSQDKPHCGIYILNRMGTGDYGRRVYPEDVMQESGQYLMYRYYPDYTKKNVSTWASSKSFVKFLLLMTFCLRVDEITAPWSFFCTLHWRYQSRSRVYGRRQVYLFFS